MQGNLIQGKEDIEGSQKREELLVQSVIPYQISSLANRMDRLLEHDIRKYDLTVPAWRVLAIVDLNGEITVNDLAAYALVEQSTLSRLIHRMVKAGLLENQKSPQDGRVRSISLTEHGRDMCATIRSIALKHTAQAMHGFNHADRARFMGLLTCLQKNLDVLEGEQISSL